MLCVVWCWFRGFCINHVPIVWGLLYGSDHIGEIKGAIAIIRNGATAIAPIGFLRIYSVGMPLDIIFIIVGLASY